jgi:hypothetical protein
MVTVNAELHRAQLTVPSVMILSQHLLEGYADTFPELLSRQTNSGQESKSERVEYEERVPITQAPIRKCHDFKCILLG